MNVITLTGNAVADTNLQYTQSGVGIGEGKIAVRRKFKDKRTGQYESDFINWKAIGKLSEIMAEHIKKGDKFGITGSLQIDRYEKDGETKYFTSVIVDTFDFPDKPKGEQQSRPQNNQPKNDDPFAGNEPVDIGDSDLPF